MSSPEEIDKEMLENLDMLLAMDVLEEESDWDALSSESLVEVPDAELEGDL